MGWQYYKGNKEVSLRGIGLILLRIGIIGEPFESYEVT